VADVVALVPVLRRPHRPAPLLESIDKATPAGAWRLLFLGSPGDEAEHEAIYAAGGELLVIDEPNAPGDWSRKINAGYRATTEPLMLLGGDDIAFRPGWLEAAQAKMVGRVGVVGTFDCHNRRVLAGEHSTHPVVARWYADRHGTIDQAGQVVHEGYAHNWTDNELVETAKSRRAWAFARDSVVEHNHPLWGRAETDDVYELGQSRFHEDRQLFMRRRRLWR
jgi:hypothetical protein